MIEALARVVGRAKRPDTPPIDPKFLAVYSGLTADQLRGCNFADRHFAGCSVSFTRRGIGYDLSLPGVVYWGSCRENTIGEILLEDTGDIGKKERPAEEHLRNFASTLERLCDVLRAKGDIYWKTHAENNAGSYTIMRAHFRLDKPDSIGHHFATKVAAADLIDSLPPGFSLKCTLADFSGLTMAEIRGSNLPRETWPEKVRQDGTHNDLSILG